MGILGNMQLLSSCSIRIRIGTVSVGEANDTIIECLQCINDLL